MLRDPADTASRDRILTLLRTLRADPANGIDQVVTRTENPELFTGFPQAAAMVVLQSDFQLGYSFSGPLVTAAPSTGMHGYLPAARRCARPFLCAGQALLKRKTWASSTCARSPPPWPASWAPRCPAPRRRRFPLPCSVQKRTAGAQDRAPTWAATQPKPRKQRLGFGPRRAPSARCVRSSAPPLS
jgi:hypothetical protein